MSRIGQIIYNLEDFHSSGGYISTSYEREGDNIKTGIVKSTDGPEAYKKRINIYENLVDKFFEEEKATKEFTKLGIQAPPGTHVFINERDILIGRTGTYELDERIAVNKLKFLQPNNYILNEMETNNKLNNGKKALNDSRLVFEKTVSKEPPLSEKENTDYWKNYNEQHEKYLIDYNSAYADFNLGVNGIYEIDEQNPHGDLYNIIIDFIY